MVKPIPITTVLRGASAAASKFTKSSKPIRPISSNNTMTSPNKDSSPAATTSSESSRRSVPLSAVVSDCAKRWFQDNLEEAKAGNITMQVVLGQMYNSGYGVPKDARKGRVWITKASRVRSSVWKVQAKRPGYNASDSDSDSE